MLLNATFGLIIVLLLVKIYQQYRVLTVLRHRFHCYDIVSRILDMDEEYFNDMEKNFVMGRLQKTALFNISQLKIQDVVLKKRIRDILLSVYPSSSSK